MLEDESGCCGILPLRPQRQKHFGVDLNVWSVPACRHDLSDLLLKPEERVDSWWPEIKAALQTVSFGWAAISIPKVLEQRIAGFQLGTLRRNAIFRPGGCSCYFPINGPYESLHARYTSRLQKILRKGWSGLAKLGTVDIYTARNGPGLANAFVEFMRLEASGWKGQHGTASALAQDSSLHMFFNQVFFGQAAERHAEINLLTVDGRAVAAQLCMVRGGVRSVVKIGHDESLQKLSPGSLLLDALLKRSCERHDVHTLSLVTGFGWMREWGAYSATVGHLWLFRSRPAAMVIRGLMRLMDRREARSIATTSDSRMMATARSRTHSGFLAQMSYRLRNAFGFVCSKACQRCRLGGPSSSERL